MIEQKKYKSIEEEREAFLFKEERPLTEIITELEETVRFPSSDEKNLTIKEVSYMILLLDRGVSELTLIKKYSSILKSKEKNDPEAQKLLDYKNSPTASWYINKMVEKTFKVRNVSLTTFDLLNSAMKFLSEDDLISLIEDWKLDTKEILEYIEKFSVMKKSLWRYPYLQRIFLVKHKGEPNKEDQMKSVKNAIKKYECMLSLNGKRAAIRSLIDSIGSSESSINRDTISSFSRAMNNDLREIRGTYSTYRGYLSSIIFWRYDKLSNEELADNCTGINWIEAINQNSIILDKTIGTALLFNRITSISVLRKIYELFPKKASFFNLAFQNDKNGLYTMTLFNEFSSEFIAEDSELSILGKAIHRFIKETTSINILLNENDFSNEVYKNIALKTFPVLGNILNSILVSPILDVVNFSEHEKTLIEQFLPLELSLDYRRKKEFNMLLICFGMGIRDVEEIN